MHATWIVAESCGLEDRIVSRHRTRDAAERAADKRNGGRGVLGARFRPVCVAGPGARVELVTVCGRETIRPLVRPADARTAWIPDVCPDCGEPDLVEGSSPAGRSFACPACGQQFDA